MITLTLTKEEAEMLVALAGGYLCKGGPAWECMPDWDEEFTSDKLEALGKKLELLGHTL